MAYIAEMVAYKALHITGEKPWRSLVDPEGLGEFSMDEIINHLTTKHGYDKKFLELTGEGEIMLHPEPIPGRSIANVM